jgi:hypothetical protein
MPAQERKVRTASNEDKIYCVYEYTDDNGDRNGIYYFEIDKNQPPLHQPETDKLLMQAHTRTANTPLVKDKDYEKLPLAQLYLDVDGDFLSLTFVPKEPGRESSKKAYSGKIQNGTFTLCPNQPPPVNGDIINVNTEFSNAPNKMAIKVFELEEGSVHIEGHG